VAWDAPRHLWHFKPQVLIEVLTRMGFNFLRITAMPLDPFYHSLLSEFLFRKGGWWRFPLRLPAVSLSAFILGNFEPEKASSILYIARKI
jgi:hypothetical protein